MDWAVPGTLPQSFYERPTLEVARDLLGKYLLRRLDGSTLAARIVEVEAYVGPDDLACHASRGRTARTEVMFGPAGHAYVYLIYGMYHCLNVVTESVDRPAAVLIRAAEAREGLPADARLDGPGRLCRALDITRRDNGLPVFDSASGLWIEDRRETPPPVASGPRVGVDYAGEWAALPWRFWDSESPAISRPSPSRRGTAARRSPQAR